MRNLSQEEPYTHDTPSNIAKTMDISESSVRRIAKHDLKLKCLKRIKGQKLTNVDHEKRVSCSKKLLRIISKVKLQRTFFSDEKIYNVNGPINSQNDRFYSQAALKEQVKDGTLYSETELFPKSLMVSGAVSKLGKTSLIIVRPGVKVNAAYYCDEILAKLIPEMNELADGGHYVFQQDGARSHTAKATIEYLECNVPEVVPPHCWPPRSPDLNPLDYGFWSSIEQNVFKEKIKDLDHLKERLFHFWSILQQDEIDRTIDLFRPRLHAVIKAEGKHIEHLKV